MSITSKKYIELPVKKIRVKIEESPFCYVIEYNRGNLKNKKTGVIEQNWVGEKFYTSLDGLVKALIQEVTIEQLEEKHAKNDECFITLRKYLDLLNENEKAIYNLLGGK